MSTEAFTHDVFLSHSAKDKAVVRAVAERLRAAGVPNLPFGVRTSDFGLSPSCLSANAFGSDWAQLEAGTFRFRDPLNQERRYMPKLHHSAFFLLPFPDAPIKGSLAQFLYINWRPETDLR